MRKKVIQYFLASPYWTPSNLVATVKSATEIDLTWSGGKLAKVERSTDGVTYTQIGTGTDSYSDSGLTADTLYYYKIKGSNDFNSVYTSVRISTLQTGLIGYWKFNESSGNAIDTLGLRNLTNNNTATFGSGKLGNAGNLGSSNTNKNFAVDNNFGLTYSSSRSFDLWFNLNNLPSAGTYFALASFLFATNPGNYTVIYYENYGGLYRFYVGNALYFNITLSTGVWYHVCITHDHGSNVIKLYLNAELRITDATWQSNYSALTTRFSVGNFNNANYSSVIVDEVGLWNKILTQEEINQRYNSGTGITHPFEDVNYKGLLLTSTAKCWFNAPSAKYVSSVGKTFIVVVHNNGTGWSQNVITLNNITGLSTVTRIGTANEQDDHNEGAIIVRSSDTKLFTSYSEHGGSVIRYRVSTNALDASAWGDEQTINPNPGNGYTYQNAFEATNGDIFIFYRINAAVDKWCYVKSVDGGATFGSSVVFSNATYHRICQHPTDKDILHFLASPHANEGLTPSSQVHYYFDCGDETWHKSDGTDITADIPLDYTDGTLIMSHNNPSQGWIEDLFVDSSGYPRVLMTYIPDITAVPSKKLLMYSEWNGSVWSTPYQIHQSNNKNMSNGSSNEKEYPALACFDRANPDRIFAGKEISDGGQTEIYEIIRKSASSFISIKKTSSSYDQWRPFTTDAPTKNVFWLNKINYDSYLDFDEELICKTL